MRKLIPLLIATLLATVSCHKAEVPQQEDASPSAKEYVMSIGFSGEITDGDSYQVTAGSVSDQPIEQN